MPQPQSSIADVTCTACGCLCDDIVLTVENGYIAEAGNACERGRAWFLSDHERPDLPDATSDGAPATREQAIARAIELVRAARAPVMLGLTETTIEVQRVAIAIADRLGARVVLGHARTAMPLVHAVQRVGKVSATLGEVKNRADVVVFWGVDPIRTHPRHWERYSVEPGGRFVPEGRGGRFVIVADEERTATAERADLFLRFHRDRQFETLWTLRTLVKGVKLDAARVQQATGVAFEELQAVADRLKSARYGAFFVDERLGSSACFEAAFLLVRDLNLATRFVALGMGSPGNPAGAEAVLTWQTGFPLAVEFGRGYPRDVLERETRDADLALVVGSAAPPAVPSIVIAPDATAPGRSATVALASATYGIHTGGTVIRVDGVSLPLRPALASTRPSDQELLESIARGLG